MTPAPRASQLPVAWDAGWLQMATHCPSPNFGPRPAATDIDLLVLHSISLPPGIYGTGDVQRLFVNQLDWDAHPYFQDIRGLKVSSHFFITRVGTVWQFVSCNDRAWHAGASSWQGRERCNDYSIGIELEGLEGLPFEAAQYAALAQVCQHVENEYPIRQIAGHEHVAPGRKQDPGSGFVWPQLQQMLNWPRAMFPPGTV
ncbi:1,6-anhydro-N-acetylmuramyl-L-alanine amidase AmpD [Comamonas sp. 4034]|uniref:1,6-anhydro-N-acetylmuramyl-L-alanine amidase AmpD n=1 Tax=Comamonas sp. 4034 TaxID=3156455 RepID=UPI003D2235E6